ncbi:MAG: hypothetical protein IJW14_04250 [Oscillospiraceae bacterium]|nr:hypothetical protein [Oscillospiraceae bacterium]
MKNTKIKQNAAGERQASDPKYARILRFAEIVAVRPRAMVRLTLNNLKIDENGDHDAKAKAEALKKEWIDKIVEKYRQGHPKETTADVARYRRKLENPSPISIRAGNRERAEKLGRPTEYDRIAVRIASVYALSHWVDETTIRNYLTK